MSPLGRPKGEYRRAQPEGCPMTPPGRPKGEYRRAQPGGTPVSRASRLRAAAWVLAALLAAQARGGSPSADTELLPPAHEVAAALAASPLWRAADEAITAEQASRRQVLAGPYEWLGTVNVGQRHYRDTLPRNAIEWEASLERALRLPGKRDAADRLGGARIELAQTQRSLTWREQARALLERYGTWLREREAARIWAEQAALLQAQAAVVAERRRLGDAARLEQVQAEAAVAQAQGLAAGADARARAAGDALARQFPTLAFPQPARLPDPPAAPAEDADWIDAQLAGAPELASARQAVQIAEELLRIEELERRPDPTVGLRVGQARDANEQFVGVVLKIPFAGEHRAAAVSVAASRTAAAALLHDAAQRRAAIDARLRLDEARIAYGGWEHAQLALDKLDQAAQGLARGYRLGEGSLAEVLAARRLANEQRAAAAAAAADAWGARWRLMLEAGRLWACPDPCPRP